MDFLASMKVVFGRWRMVLPCLVLTVIGTAFAVRSVEPTYTASGTVLLFYPTHINDPETGETNAYLSFGSLTVVANVLCEVLEQDSSQSVLARRGATAQYDVGTDPASTTPLITVIATGEEQAVVETARAVIDRLGEELQRRQRVSGAPRLTWITADTVTAPDKAVPQLGSRAKVGVGIGILGLAGSFSIAFLADALAARRTRARAELVGPGIGARTNGVAAAGDDHDHRELSVRIRGSHPA